MRAAVRGLGALTLLVTLRSLLLMLTLRRPQSVPVPVTGGTAAPNVTWNEVFSFPRTCLEVGSRLRGGHMTCAHAVQEPLLASAMRLNCR
jgi:hypothetical protein